MNAPDLKNLPEDIVLTANLLVQLASEVMGQESESMPKVVVQNSFPPMYKYTLR